MKFLITVCLLAALATIAWTDSARWGTYQYGDILLYREEVVRNAPNNDNWDVVYFPKNNVRGGLVSYVNVTDHRPNNTGAIPFLWAGGPGYRFAKIGLKRQYRQIVNSTVKIFGKYY